MNCSCLGQAIRSTALSSSLLAINFIIAEPQARAEVMAHYRFDNNLFDSATAGARLDNLSPLFVGGGGTVGYGPGMIGQAVRLDTAAGTAFSLRASDSPDLHLGTNWTLEAFVKPDIGNWDYWDRFWTKWGNSGDEWHWAFTHDNDGLDLFATPTVSVGTNYNPLRGDDGPLNSVPQGQWSHVAIVGDGAAQTIKGFINGREVVSGGYISIVPRNQFMAFGTFDDSLNGLELSGWIDDAKIHNVAVTTDYLRERASVVPPFPTFVQTSTFSSTIELPFLVSNSDLLQTATSAVSGFTRCCSGGEPVLLTDGGFGPRINDVSSRVVDDDARWSVIYKLDLTGAPDGYSLTQIDTFTGDPGFAAPRYAVSVSTVGDEGFQQIGTVVYFPTAAGSNVENGSTKISLRGEGEFIASRVDAIRFVFLKSYFGHRTGYREIDAFGVPTVVPEPSASLMLGAGLVSLLAVAKRRCRQGLPEDRSRTKI